MNSSRMWFVGAVCLLCAGWGAIGRAQSATTNQTTRIIIYPGPKDSIAQLQKEGITKAESYGTYWLAEATGSQLSSLKKSLGSRLQEADYLNKIELAEASFDVTKGAPAVAENLREPAGAAKLLRIVQFKGPVSPAWMDQLKAIKNVQVIHYIPYNAYLVSVASGAETNLQSLTVSNGPVQWIGVYHPSYKLPKNLQTATGLLTARVAVFNGDDAAGTLQALRRYGQVSFESQQKALSQWLVTLKVDARDLPAIAQIPAVLWIQPVTSIVKRDEVQGLVLSGDLSPSVGDSYVSYLAAIGFVTNSTAYYPVLDICDTGVDADSPYCKPTSDFALWHPAFASYPSFSVDPSDECCYGSRKAYGFTDTDTDGHGTRVASIAIGADGWTNELVNCYTQITPVTTNCTWPTNLVIIGYNFDPCVGPSPPACCLSPTGCPIYVTAWPTNCIVSNGVCEVVTNAPKAPPPYYLSRMDLSGFHLGLGISPFGAFGTTLMSDAQADPEGIVQGAYLDLARISNNSWNEALDVGVNDGAYDSLSQSYDTLTRDALSTGITNTQGQLPRNQEMLFVFAGGNDNGQDPINGGYGDVLTTPPATGKNIIAVGATNLRYGGSVLSLSPFSSFGPTRDGRFKPDVVAPGEGVTAATSQALYSHPNCSGDCGGFDPALLVCTPDYSSNNIISELYNDIASAGPSYVEWPVVETEANGVTSYSAPAVSGGAQLLYSYFITPTLLPAQQPEPILPPSPAMMKAYILNSARYLPIISPFTGSADKLPSIGQGMGMIDLGRMFDGEPRVIRDESAARAIDLPLYSTNTVIQQTFFSASGQSYEISGQITDPSQEFRVTLAWTDAPGTPGNGPQLVNNLDLQVTVNGQTYYGNDFDTQYSAISPVAKFDNLNNVESVFLPPGTTGTFDVIVRATDIAGEGVPNTRTSLNQDFALVVYNANPTLVSDLPPRGVTTNNTCQTAQNITAYPFTWVNQINTNDYVRVNPSSTAARGGIQEFFRIPAPSPGTEFNINTFGSTFDTVLSVWRGSCGGLIEVTSNNDSSNTLQSAVSFTADGIEDYYIIAEPHNNGITNGLSATLVLNVEASSSPVIITPNPLLFPDQITGTTGSVESVTLQNGLSIPLNVQSVTVTGANASAFIIVSDTCSGSQLAPTNGTCTISLAFAPTSPGSNQTADLLFTDTATGSPQIVPLSGNGLPPAPVAVITPNSLVFSNQPVGNPSAPQTITVQNTGSAPLILSNFTVLGIAAGDFNISGTTCGSLPSSIAPGGSCALSVIFQPSASGDRYASVSITNNAGNSPQSVNLIGLGCATITVLPATLPALTTATAYTTNLTASGGASPYTFALSGGNPPAGLTVSPSGVLAGTPTAIGTFTFSVTAIDANGCLSTPAVYTVTINCGTLTLQPTTLPNVLEGTAYTNFLSALGSIPPVTYAVTSGALPTGLVLSNNVIVGTPTVASTFTFGITATDSNRCTGTQSYTIVVTPTAPAVSLNPVQLFFTDQLVGTTSAVQQVILSNSGTAPLTIDNISFVGGNTGDFVFVTAGCLGSPIPPQGSCTISVSAAPTTKSGLLNTTLQILSTAGNGTNNVPVHGSGIAPVMALSTNVLNFGTNAVNAVSPPQVLVIQNIGNAPLTITGVVIGGVNPGDFTITTNTCSGSAILPGQVCMIDLTFKTATTLQRAAMLTITSNATNTPQIVALQGNGQTCPIITMSPTVLTNAMTGLSYSQTITATNGTAPYTFSVTSGALPPGLTLSPSGVLSGTTTSSGSYTFTIQATDVLGCTASTGYSMNTGCPILGLTAFSVSNTLVGVAFSQTITVTNGTAPYAFSLTSGALPAGVTLSGAGVVSGTPTNVGLYNFTIQAKDTNGCTGAQGYSLAVSCPAIGLVPTSLTNMSIGIAFNMTLAATNGTSPYVFTLISGTLPSGLSLTADGKLSGTPTTAGTFAFTIQAADAHGCLGQQSYSVPVSCPTITLVPTTLPDIQAEVVFSDTIVATNGAAPYTFSVTAGSLPPGVLLTTSGTLTGTPATVGSFAFTVQAADSHNCVGSQAYSFSTYCPFTYITPFTLPNGNAGNDYFSQLTVIGSTASETYTVTSGTLPPGLFLTSDGFLTGVPTALGSYTFGITATDPAGCSAEQGYTIAITCPPLVYFSPSSPLPVATRGLPYSQLIQAYNETAPVTYTITSGTLPPGLTFSNAGLLAGTPSTSGTYTFVVKAVDVNGCQGTMPYSLTVSCVAIAVTPTTLPNPTLGVSYNQTIVAAGPTGTVNFAQTAGTIPPGLTLASSGVLSGTPTLMGSFTFEVSVLDSSSGCSGARFYTLVVGCPTIGLSPATLPFGNVGTAYSQAFTPMGGAPPYKFTQTGGSLPSGMTLSSTGVISGTPLSGSSVFTVSVTDSNGCVSSLTYTLVLANNCPTITVAPVTLPVPTDGAPYSQTLSVGGGVAPYTFSVFSGALPGGLTLTSAGVLSGSLTSTSTVNFTVVALDSAGCPGFQSYSLNGTCGTITLTPSTLATGLVGVAYSQSIVANGGVAPHTFAVTGGALPPGLVLDSTGALSGTPTAAGSFACTVTATDGAGCTGSQLYSLVMVPTADLELTETNVPNPVVVNSNLTYTIEVANLGPSLATSVTITDVLPAGVDFVAASSGCAADNGIVACDLGSVASGTSVSVSIVVTPTTSGTLTNSATVSSSVADLITSNNTAAALTVVNAVVELNAATQLVSADAAAATMNVIRLGDPNSVVTVQYATGGGTAVAGTDYVATSGILTFAPGVTQSTIAVPLLNHKAALTKTVNLNLQNPAGADLGGQSAATINIIGSAAKNAFVFTNAGNDVVTVKLSGAGSMVVSLLGSNTGPIGEITLTNTESTTSLSVSVKRKSGTGKIDIDSIVSDGSVKSIAAASANLVGAGISVGGSLGNVTLDSLSNGSVTAVDQIGKVQISSVDTNSNAAFGVTAQSIGSVSVAKPHLTWKPADGSNWSSGDFHVTELGISTSGSPRAAVKTNEFSFNEK